MSRLCLLYLSAPLWLGGCLYHVREKTDQVVCDLAAHSLDPQPTVLARPTSSNQPARDAEAGRIPVSSAKWAQGGVEENRWSPSATTDLQTVAYLQKADDAAKLKDIKEKLKIPEILPGSEAPIIQPLPKDEVARQREVRRLYPELPPMPTEPIPLAGPNGNPYTLSDLQHIAATNSPQLVVAAAAVFAAEGNMIQAGAYPNPTVSYLASPSNDGSTAGYQGFGIDQNIKTFGKLKLAQAAAKMDLENARLALHRAQTDLATQVRTAYFALLVAKETVRVTKALAEFTDDVYRVQELLLERGFAAPYEPAALRSQAWSARLAYKQAITTYISTWQQLVAAVGLRQLPLSEVAGRIDAFIPCYDFDAIKAHVLTKHTDVLTARNGIEKAKYNLQLAQITPYPDIDVNVAVQKEFALPPFQMSHTVSVGIPLPLWDQNKGNIMAAEAALKQAMEQPHVVELNLTSALSTAYMNYKNNLHALEDYRKLILPDQVRTYRGVFERRLVDFGVAGIQGVTFGDLVSAQQSLAANVTTYLGVLGQVWTSVVSVADLLQTDDLFQFAYPFEAPPLLDLEQLPPLPCCHPCACGPAMPQVSGPASASGGPMLPPFEANPGHVEETAQQLPAPRKALPPGPRESNQQAPRPLPPGLGRLLPVVPVEQTGPALD
jgi:cobalt-zinc-cadmium efflux system outer membrane protein